jgi:hypothetical protein
LSGNERVEEKKTEGCEEEEEGGVYKNGEREKSFDCNHSFEVNDSGVELFINLKEYFLLHFFGSHSRVLINNLLLKIEFIFFLLAT